MAASARAASSRADSGVAEGPKTSMLILSRLSAIVSNSPLPGRGPPRVSGLMRSALLAADLVLIPVQPSPLDGWATGEMLALLDEARIWRPALIARMVLNRCAARTVIARETAASLASHQPPLIGPQIGQRVIFAEAARAGRLVSEIDAEGAAAREIAALARAILGLGSGEAAR